MGYTTAGVTFCIPFFYITGQGFVTRVLCPPGIILLVLGLREKGRRIMIVNGVKTKIEQGTNLLKFLEYGGYNLSRIAVERNGEIVPQASYHEVELTEADTIEIVSFVGGG